MREHTLAGERTRWTSGTYSLQPHELYSTYKLVIEGDQFPGADSLSASPSGESEDGALDNHAPTRGSVHEFRCPVPGINRGARRSCARKVCQLGGDNSYWMPRRTCAARSRDARRATRCRASSIPADTPAEVITSPSST